MVPDVNFADESLPVGSIVATLVVIAVSLSWHILGGLSSKGNVSEEEKRHWDSERRQKRILIEECLRGIKDGAANPVRIWEAIYDEAEGIFVTSPPFGLAPGAGALPERWLPQLVEALAAQLTGALALAHTALVNAEDQVQRSLRSTTGEFHQKELDAIREERAARLAQLAELCKKCDAIAKAFKLHTPPARLPMDFVLELDKAQRLLRQQEEIKRGLTWDIGRQIVDPQIAFWLALGVTFKVLMGAPAPLQVLALSDAARGMARGGEEGYQEFVTAIGNCFFFFCLEKLLQFVARILMIRGEFLFVQKLQRKVYSKMLQQDYEFFDGKPTAALQNLVHESTKQVCSSLIFVRVRLIQVCATVFFQVVLIAWRFPKLALIVNLSLPVAGVLRYCAKGYIERSGARLKARTNLVGQRTWDVLANLPTVRSHCRELGAVEDYSRCMAYQGRLTTKLDIFNGVMGPFMHFCDMICVYVGYFYGGRLIREGTLTTAELMTVIRQFQTVALELSVMLDTISGSMLSSEHGRDVLDLLLSRPKIEPDVMPSRPKPRGAKGDRRNILQNTRVEFREVEFVYPAARLRSSGEDRRVLRGISFVADEGQFTALVGKTGCGKTTTTHLLQRLYDVDKGEVLVGGVNVMLQDVHKLRRSIAVVSQEPVLFHTSIHENLLYAFDEDSRALDPLEKEKLMIEACRRADAWDFVNALPEGLRTDIGPRGSQLSGGQKQRLTIARAILKDAPLLVLDEATSSLDVEAEQAVQQALDQLMCASTGVGGRPVTRLVIAHRLSTIRRADKIVALEGGVVREQGNHEDLLAKDGAYAHFQRLSLGVQVPETGMKAPAPVDKEAPTAAGTASLSPSPATPSTDGVSAEVLAEVHGHLGDLRGRLLKAPSGGDAKGDMRSIADEVERCQQRLAGLLERR